MGLMQVLLQWLLQRSSSSSCLFTAPGFLQKSQHLLQGGVSSPKYFAMAAWRQLGNTRQNHLVITSVHKNSTLQMQCLWIKIQVLFFSQRMSIPAGITGFNPWSRIQALFLAPCLKFLYLHLPICKKKNQC